jgi:cellulose synthase/poly-beta-1,6-N-acetylglucosamine synthase-like glycosyltransferase
MLSTKFAVIIPVKQINNYVHQTVSVIRESSYKNWELFVVVNEYERNPWEEVSNIHLIVSGRVGPGRKRDLAAKESTAEFLVFLDDDSFPGDRYFETALEFVSGRQVDVVCGPGITPKSSGFKQQLSAAPYLSIFAGGNPSRYLSRGIVRQVREWPSVNLIVRRLVFIDSGGFDTDYWPGEDTILCMKLQARMIPIWYQPSLVVWHHRREGLVAHARQVGAYGLHRGFFLKTMSPSFRELKYALPSIFLASALLMSAIPIFRNGSVWPVLALAIMYSLLILLVALEVLMRVGFRVAICAIPYYAVTHIVYGTQFLRGFLFTRELISRLR